QATSYRLASALALRELEPLSRALLAVLLAFLLARIASHQSFGLEQLAQLRVEFDQGAGNAHLHRVGLRTYAAAAHRVKHVEALRQFRHRQGALGRNPLLFGHKMLFELLAV